MSRFPLTRRSVILSVRSAHQQTHSQALDTLATNYWRPVYKYLRVRWNASPEDAQDLTQGFFAAALEKGFFERYDRFEAVAIPGFASARATCSPEVAQT